MVKILSLIFFAFIVLICSPAYAYLGPGMAGGVIATVLGIIAAFFLALFGILYYPIKRALKNKKQNKMSDNIVEQQNDDATS